MGFLSRIFSLGKKKKNAVGNNQSSTPSSTASSTPTGTPNLPPKPTGPAPLPPKPTGPAPLPPKPTGPAPLPPKPTGPAPLPPKPTGSAPLPPKPTGPAPKAPDPSGTIPVKPTGPAPLPPKPTGKAPLPPKPTGPAPKPTGSGGQPQTANQKKGKKEQEPLTVPGGPLTTFEKKVLEHHKKSKLPALAAKIQPWGNPYPKPMIEQGPSGVAKFGSVAGTAIELLGDVCGGGAETAETIGDFANAGKTIPIVGAVVKGVQTLYKIGKGIKDLVDNIRTGRKQGFSGGTILNMVSGILEMILSGADAVMSGLAIFSEIPVVGGLISIACAAVSSVSHIKQIFEGDSRLFNMRRLKDAAKETILEAEGGSEFVKEGAPDKKNKFVGTFGNTTDEKTGTTRKKRLDEQTSDMKFRTEQKARIYRRSNGGKLTKEQAAELNKEDWLRKKLEDYDITKELAGANKKRRDTGLFDFFVGDVTQFVQGLLNIVPEPACKATAAAIGLAVASAKLGKVVATSVRRLGRNKGWKGFSQNKSDANKLNRRHTLAVNLYQRVRELNDYPLNAIVPDETDPDKVEMSKASLTKYNRCSLWVDALGVGYGALNTATSANEMVALMRSGFYRESG